MLHDPVGQPVEPARLRGVGPARPLLRADPERGSEVAEGESDHLRGRRIDPQLTRDERGASASRGDLHADQAKRPAAGRRHCQLPGHGVAVPRGARARQRMQRAGRREVVAEDPHRVVHAARDEPRAVPHARELERPVPGLEAASDHVHPEVVRLLPLHPRHLLLDRRRRHLGPDPPSDPDRQPVADRRLIVAHQRVARPPAGHGPLDELLDGWARVGRSSVGWGRLEGGGDRQQD